MAIVPRQKRAIKVYYQVNTKNSSFLKQYTVLKRMGVENTKFHLILYDKDLMNIDPHNIEGSVPPHMINEIQIRIMHECQRNFWYFIREVVRIPEPGNKMGIRYNLHRGNLSMSYCLTRNLNVYLELPRQNGKTISAACWYLWVYLFGTTNSQIMFANKSKGQANENLKKLKNIRDLLPDYMKIRKFSESGKELKLKENVESMENHVTLNSIITIPSARSVTHADQLSRGCTQPLQWYDEYAFIQYNEIVYLAAAPAFSQASRSAKANKKPYGMLMTSTPGDMSQTMGADAYQLINTSANFSNKLFDWNTEKIEEYRRRNGTTPFFYIKFMYYEIGRDEVWFKEQCELLKWKWEAIKREVLLEWAKGSADCPFSEEELDLISQHVKQPLRIVHINTYYPVAIYEEVDITVPQIIGVDVSGGYNRDSSTFVALSSKTTKVQAVFNNNRIGINELSYLLIEYIRSYSPNAILAIERNSYGEGVISNLRKSKVKNNLYYNFKKDDTRDKVKDGRPANGNSVMKEYGVYTTAKTRGAMMDILRSRVAEHPDKFVSKMIVSEMEGLIFDPKKGRIDHGANSHDDTVMAMLIGLYVYYYGKDLHSYGVFKRDIPRFGESAADEDMTHMLKDPVHEVDIKMNGSKLYSTLSMKSYFKKLEKERMQDLERVEAREAMKAQLGTGRVQAEMFNDNSDFFAMLNNVDEVNRWSSGNTITDDDFIDLNDIGNFDGKDFV